MKKIIGALLALVCSSVFATTLVPVVLLNPTGSTSGQAIVSTGASSAPGWSSIVDSVIAGSGITVSGATGNVTVSVAANAIALTQLAQQSANTVLANATGSTANVTAFSMPSCSTSSSALNWTSGTGFGCNASVNAASLGGATFASPGSIGSTTAGSGAFTTLSASSTVSGTGFSTYLASPPAIGGTTAAAGSFTTLNASGLFTPSSTIGIKGTATNDSAQAGSIGEVNSPSTTGVSMTNNTAVNLTSTSTQLTAGDWRCTGSFLISDTSTTLTNVAVGLSSNSATLGGTFTYSQLQGATYTAWSGPVPTLQFKLTGPTTVYLVGTASFASGTVTGNGLIFCSRGR